MKLKSWIKKHPNTKFCVGTESGGSYMFFGASDNCEEEILKRFEEYREKILTIKADNENDVVSLIKSIPDRIENGKLDEDKDYLNIGKRIAVEYLKIRDKRDYLNRYGSPLERQVVDAYERTLDGYTTIIVTGTEKGTFWYPEEYFKKHGTEPVVA